LVNDAVEEALGFVRVDASDPALDVTDAADEPAVLPPEARR
jgi:hypothetical protein